MLNKKQLDLIEYLVEGMPVMEAVQKAGVPKSTYYDWMKNPNHEFTKAYEEMLNFHVSEVKKSVKKDANNIVKALQDILYKGDNENARVNASAKLMTFAELDPSSKQELTIKNDDSDKKNVLLDMLKKSKQVGE